MTTIVLIFPAVQLTAGDHEFAARQFANRSVFSKITALVKSADFTASPVINVSTFGHVRLTTGDDFDIIPTPFANASTFGSPELDESGPDVNLRPTQYVNASTFGAPELDESADDVNLRVTAFGNVSTFGSQVLSPVEGGGGDDETDGDDAMIAGSPIGGTTI